MYSHREQKQEMVFFWGRYFQNSTAAFRHPRSHCTHTHANQSGSVVMWKTDLYMHEVYWNRADVWVYQANRSTKVTAVCNILSFHKILTANLLWLSTRFPQHITQWPSILWRNSCVVVWTYIGVLGRQKHCTKPDLIVGWFGIMTEPTCKMKQIRG